MTKLQLITGAVYTELSAGEIRTMLQGGSKTGTFKGYLNEDKTQPLIIAIHAVEYIYM